MIAHCLQFSVCLLNSRITMSTEALLSDRRFRWVSKIYFHLSASPNYNLNSFENIVSFLDAKVGDLFWGKNDAERKASKEKFSKAFIVILSMYDFHLPPEQLHNVLSDDTLKNYSLVQKLSAAGMFTGK